MHFVFVIFDNRKAHLDVQPASALVQSASERGATLKLRPALSHRARQLSLPGNQRAKELGTLRRAHASLSSRKIPLTSPAVRFEQLDSIPLAVIRRQARASELSRVVPECCGLVWNAVRAQQARGGRHVAIYWNNSIRLEVGVELLGPFSEAGEVVRSATPAGPAAWATHLGPYGGLGAAHEAVRQWCRANNRQVAGPNWEIYGHWQNEWNSNPSLIQTDVYYLLTS